MLLCLVPRYTTVSRRVVVSGCVYKCMMSKIAHDSKNPPRYGIGGPTCTSWIAGLFNGCGFRSAFGDPFGVSAPLFPSSIGNMANYINDSRNSNAADRACECKRKQGASGGW